jgi:hypothetical protein
MLDASASSSVSEGKLSSFKEVTEALFVPSDSSFLSLLTLLSYFSALE